MYKSNPCGSVDPAEEGGKLGALEPGALRLCGRVDVVRDCEPGDGPDRARRTQFSCFLDPVKPQLRIELEFGTRPPQGTRPPHRAA